MARNPAPALDRPWRRPGALRYALEPDSRHRQTAGHRHRSADRHRHRPRRRALPTRDGTVLRINVFRNDGRRGRPVILSIHPVRQGQPADAAGQEVDVLAAIPRDAPAPAGDVLGADRLGGTGPGVVGARKASPWSTPTRAAAAIPTAPGSCCRARRPRTPTTWCSGSPTSRGATAMSSCSGCPTWPSASTPSPPCSRRRCGRSARGKASPTRIATSPFPGGVREYGFTRMWSRNLRRDTRQTYNLAQMQDEHPLRDDFWRSLVPDLSAIKVPMLVCGSFSDNNLHSRGSIRAFTPRRLQPRPPLHPSRRQMGDLLLRSRTGRAAEVLPRRAGRRARIPAAFASRCARTATPSPRCAKKPNGRWPARVGGRCIWPGPGVLARRAAGDGGQHHVRNPFSCSGIQLDGARGHRADRPDGCAVVGRTGRL